MFLIWMVSGLAPTIPEGVLISLVCVCVCVYISMYIIYQRNWCAGTFRHTGQLDVVERYDPRVNKWEELEPLGVPIQFCAGVFLF